MCDEVRAARSADVAMNEKLAIEREVLGNGRGAQDRAGAGSANGAAYAVPVSVTGAKAEGRSPLRFRLESRLQVLSENVGDLLRLKQLLSEHPEFEQFLEFERLVNRHGLR